MCSEREMFRVIQTVPKYTVVLGDSIEVTSTVMGEVDLILTNSDEKTDLGTWWRLSNILLLEQMGLNLLSMNRIDENNIHSSFKNRMCEFMEGKTG